jgi:hypothetical protein
MKQRIKNFNTHGFNAKLREGTETSSKAKALSDAINAFDGLNELTIINKFISDKTGFANLKMGADSLNLLEEYTTFKTLEGTINLSNYNEDLTDWSANYKEELREFFTTYWSDQDSKDIDDVTKILDKLNEKSLFLRYSIFKDRNNLMTFSDSQYWMYIQEQARADRKLKKS